MFVWDTSKTGPGGKEEIVVSNTVLAVDSWRHYLAIGSTSVQVIDMNDTTRKWTISEEDEKAKVSQSVWLSLWTRCWTKGLDTSHNAVRLTCVCLLWVSMSHSTDRMYICKFLRSFDFYMYLNTINYRMVSKRPVSMCA